MDINTSANMDTSISASMHAVVPNNALLILLAFFFLFYFNYYRLATEVLWNTNPQAHLFLFLSRVVVVPNGCLAQPCTCSYYCCDVCGFKITLLCMY